MRGLWKSDLIFPAALVALAFLAYLIPEEEIDRMKRAQAYQARFMEGCLPRKGDKVIAEWVGGSLICHRISTSPRYGRTFPHAEVRVAEIEDAQ